MFFDRSLPDALEKAAAMANRVSTCTTQLYDRRYEQVSLDEVERSVIYQSQILSALRLICCAEGGQPAFAGPA